MKKGKTYTTKKLSEGSGYCYSYTAEIIRSLESMGKIELLNENSYPRIYSIKEKEPDKSQLAIQFEIFCKEICEVVDPDSKIQFSKKGLSGIFNKEELKIYLPELLKAFFKSNELRSLKN